MSNSSQKPGLGPELRGEDGGLTGRHRRGDIGDGERGPESPDRAPELSLLCCKNRGPEMGGTNNLLGEHRMGAPASTPSHWLVWGRPTEASGWRDMLSLQDLGLHRDTGWPL